MGNIQQISNYIGIIYRFDCLWVSRLLASFV